MKRVLIILLMICSLFVFGANCEENSNSKVTIYMFRGVGCTECADAIKLFNEQYKLADDSIDFKIFEVWMSTPNNELYNNVINHFGDEPGILPYFVVGNKSFKGEFNENLASQIVDAAKNEIANANHFDYVNKTINDLNLEVSIETLNTIKEDSNIALETTEDEQLAVDEYWKLHPEDTPENTSKEKQVNDKTMIYIVIATVAVAAFAVTGIIIVSKNKKKKTNKNTL